MCNSKLKEEPFQFITLQERIFYAIGLFVVIFCVPLIAIPLIGALLWDFCDRGGRGRPLEGLTMKFAGKFNQLTHKFNAQFVKQPADSFMVNVAILTGVLVPALFFYNMWYTVTFGLSLKMVVIYHVLRLGPYFMHFAYVYTLCHKEGHSQSGLFHNKLVSSIFNWWVGLFYGVMPSSFAYGHSVNHHKYNNGPSDVVSTSDKPRDNARAWIAYIFRFFLYSINITTIIQFMGEKNYKLSFRMFLGTIYALAFMALCYSFSSFSFLVFYLFYPVVEASVLLSIANWVWHAFLDPEDVEDFYVGSVTLLDGPINVLNEDYHVVHHQYPGVHWEKNTERFEKHLKAGEYEKKIATAFKGTHVFELFFFIILRDYEKMKSHFHDFSGKLTPDDIERILKIRLRTCW